MYYVTGEVIYTKTVDRNNAVSAIQSVLNSYQVTGVTTAFPAGLNTSGNDTLTLSVAVADEDIETFREAIRVAWTGHARSSANMGAAKI